MDGEPITVDALLAEAEWVRRLARALLRDDSAADDLTQDVLDAAIHKPPPPGTPLTRWLGGVTRNLAFMRWRADGRRRRREEAVPPADDVPSPETLVERAQAQQRLAQHLLSLEEPLRGTLLLHYYEGLEAAEIARRLSVPAGTIRWRLKTARDELRRRMDVEDAAAGQHRRWAALLAPIGTSLPSLLTKGAIAMKASQLIVGVLVFAIGGWLALRALHKGNGAAATPSVSARRAAGHAVEPPELAMRQAPARVDVDPVGTLRLEGQVIDEAERPVAGAAVALEGTTRLLRSGEDGSFVFDQLVAGAYRLEARTEDGHAGPVETRLSKASDPVILRVRAGGTLEVEVRAAGTGVPIANAEVELRSSLVWKARTDDKGHSALRGIGPGWPVLHVSAAGFAPAALLLRTSGDAQRPQRQLMTLRRGAAVAGVVLDESGKPIAGAHVVAVATAEPFPVVDTDRDGTTTQADGTWHLDTVAAGSYRFVALHADHAQGTTPPIALDGEHARDRIEIRMATGATLRGAVIDERQQPVAGARVRVARIGAVVFAVEREVRSDESGRFAMRALPVGPADASASIDDASSALQRVELVGEKDITLQLSLRGTIEGLAVGVDGKPVPEARLLIEPTWTGALVERDAWAARGVPETLADGGGRFRFAGLPLGSYQLRGTRPGATDETLWTEKGTEAKTGDRELRVVVRGDGKVRGRVKLRDGGSPEVFSIEIGAARPEPFSLGDGSFELDAPSGTRELIVTGPTFQRASVPRVVIEEGGNTDVGTITVDKGRSVSGRVLDGSGRPVAGAEVAGGLLLTGDGGARLDIPSEGFRVQETLTDAAGRYVLRGFGEHPITLVAGLKDVGRANPVRIARGPSSAEIDLVLLPTGSLAGAITRDGKPIAEAVVIANPRSAASSSNFFVTTGADGSYVFDTLSAGDWVVSPMLGGGGLRPKDMFFLAVTITAGKQARGDIAVPNGAGDVTIQVLDAKGAVVPLAQVTAVGGALSGASPDPLDAIALLAAGQLLPLYNRMAIGAPVQITGLLPGPYTFCGIPLPADPNDPASMRSVRDIVYTLPSICTTASAGAPGQQIELRATAPSSTSPAPSKK